MARDETQLLEMGQRIKELREQRGYKQQWIADQIGVELRTFQFWQQGKSKPEQENLEKLAKLFGVDPTFILRGDTPDPFQSSDAANQLARLELRLGKTLERLAALEEQVRLLRAELVARDAAELTRTEEVLDAIRDLREQPPR